MQTVTSCVQVSICVCVCVLNLCDLQIRVCNFCLCVCDVLLRWICMHCLLAIYKYSSSKVFELKAKRKFKWFERTQRVNEYVPTKLTIWMCAQVRTHPTYVILIVKTHIGCRNFAHTLHQNMHYTKNFSPYISDGVLYRISSRTSAAYVVRTN